METAKRQTSQPRDGDVAPRRTTPPDRATLGRYGERMAERYLRERGITVLERNWRCALGEIDLIALDGDCLVVCEVKTRRSTTYGSPVEAVTVVKLARLRRLAATWLTEHDTHVGDVRVDVIGVLRPRRGACRIEHLVGVGA